MDIQKEEKCLDLELFTVVCESIAGLQGISENSTIISKI